MGRTPVALLSPADRARLHDLRVMKGIALGALVVLAAVFLVAFPLQQTIPWMAYVRAAAEGGMVGALADWFAVTALFRRPLGLPIPHTAIVPTRKDEIGATLGDFIETNFLAEGVVRTALAEASPAARVGDWLRRPGNAERLTSEGSTVAVSVLRALGDDEVQPLIEDLARENLVSPTWGPPLGAWLERLVTAGAHGQAVDLVADSLAGWLRENRALFTGVVSGRLPSWVPRVVTTLIDEAVYNEAAKFVGAVRADPRHPARRALDAYLARLADDLQHDAATIARFEGAKDDVFDSPRVRELAARAWETTKNGLIAALEDPAGPLRRRSADAVAEVGERLVTDAGLRMRVDSWVSDAAAFLVDRYRHDIASIVTTTVERWDAEETTQKIELLVGRDLQYIRLNGTIVGSLAGLAIYTVAHAFFGG